ARGLSALLIYEPDFRTQLRGQEERVHPTEAYQVLRTAILKSWAGPVIHKAFVSLKSIHGAWSRWRIIPRAQFQATAPKSSHPMSLPTDSNLKLIAAWNGVVATQLPMLVITAPMKKQRPEFDYISYLLASQPVNVQHIPVHGTNHAFVEGEGEQAII